MKFTNVELSIACPTPEKLNRLNQRLDDLDVEVIADITRLNPDYAKTLQKGFVRIDYFSEGVIQKRPEGDLEGDTIIITLHKKIQDQTPDVELRADISRLGKNFKISYQLGLLELIRLGDDPIRYSFSQR